MPYFIPEKMPVDWIVPALDGLSISSGDDRAEMIQAAMEQAYDAMLKGIGVAGINGKLRVACLAAAQRMKANAGTDG